MIVNGQKAIKILEKDNNILKFNNFHKQMPVPFVIYAGFKAIKEKVQGSQPNNCWLKQYGDFNTQKRTK